MRNKCRAGLNFVCRELIGLLDYRLLAIGGSHVSDTLSLPVVPLNRDGNVCGCKGKGNY